MAKKCTAVHQKVCLRFEKQLYKFITVKIGIDMTLKCAEYLMSFLACQNTAYLAKVNRHIAPKTVWKKSVKN